MRSLQLPSSTRSLFRNDLSPGNLARPPALAGFCTTDRYDRAAHTYGKSYPDYVSHARRLQPAPDVVAHPQRGEISAVMEWASSSALHDAFGRLERLRRRRAARRRHGTRPPSPSICAPSKVVEVDRYRAPHRSKPAPMAVSENQLAHGFTLRHFPSLYTDARRLDCRDQAIS